MQKCMASKDGVCRNVYGFGTKCDGYSKGCKLKEAYDSIANIVERQQRVIKNAFGIKGDRE